MKLKLKKGDSVLVISGKDKGKQGTILHAYPETGKVIVDGVAITKHAKRAVGGQAGTFVEKPRAIDASNVMFMDPKEKKGTRIGRRVEEGKIVRFAKKSGATLS